MKVSALLPSSIRPAARRARRRERATVRSGERRVRFGSIPPSLSSSSVPSTATRSPGHHPMVAARALGHLAAVARHDGYRSQVPEVPAEGRVVGPDFRLGHLHLHYREVHAGQLNAVRRRGAGRPRQRRAGQGGDIEHAPLARDTLEGAADGRVGHLGHDPHVGPDLPDPQCGLERVDLLHLGVDHRHGMLPGPHR